MAGFVGLCLPREHYRQREDTSVLLKHGVERLVEAFFTYTVPKELLTCIHVHLTEAASF